MSRTDPTARRAGEGRRGGRNGPHRRPYQPAPNVVAYFWTPLFGYVQAQPATTVECHGTRTSFSPFLFDCDDLLNGAPRWEWPRTN